MIPNFNNMPWGGVAQEMTQGPRNTMAGAWPYPTDAHNAAVQNTMATTDPASGDALNAALQKTMSDAGFIQPSARFFPVQQPQQSQQPAPAPAAPAPAPSLNQTITQAMQPSDAGVGQNPSPVPEVPGQLPASAGLTQPQTAQPSALQQTQYGYQPQQTQTVLDTLRQGAQIQ